MDASKACPFALAVRREHTYDSNGQYCETFVAANRDENGNPLPSTLCVTAACGAWRKYYVYCWPNNSTGVGGQVEIYDCARIRGTEGMVTE